MLLDDSPVPAFLVGDGNAVRRCNGAAHATLATSGPPLAVRNGVLRAATPDATRKLHALVAAARDPDPARRQGGIMPMPRDGRAPWVISVVPIRRETDIFAFEIGAEHTALIRVRDGERSGAIPAQRLQEAFGLTHTEARVAVQLLSGREPRRAAQQLGISYYTVRGHLARMFDKTGVHRQSELVQLLTRVIGELPQ